MFQYSLVGGTKWIENVGTINPVAGSDNILQKCRVLA